MNGIKISRVCSYNLGKLMFLIFDLEFLCFFCGHQMTVNMYLEWHNLCSQAPIKKKLEKSTELIGSPTFTNIYKKKTHEELRA